MSLLTNPISRILGYKRRVEQAVSNLQNQNNILVKKTYELELELADIKRSQLRLRKLAAPKVSTVDEVPKYIDDSKIADFYSLTLKKIEALCPQNFKKWEKLLYVNEDTYVHEPVGSCSIDGHREAELFSCFMAGYLTGSVLDVGCGPYPVPSYLSDYPLKNISGLDPLDPISPHPFQYVKGFCEYLPWKDESFESVIVATSLDHVLVPDQCMKEISRVLTKGGKFLVWVSFMDSTHEYDPFDPNLEPIDKWHLFHFNKSYFNKMIAPYFNVIEELPVSNSSYFYALSKKHSS